MKALLGFAVLALAGCGVSTLDLGGEAGNAGTSGTSGAAATGGSAGLGGSSGSSGTSGTAGTSGTGGTAGSAGMGGTAGTGGAAGTSGAAGTGGMSGTGGSGATGGTAGSAGSGGTGGAGGTGGTGGVVDPPVDPKMVVLGPSNTCVVQQNDATRCWGANDVLQLDSADSKNVDCMVGRCLDNPTTVPDLNDPSALALGVQHGCAILPSGDAACFGRNDFAQLGAGSSDTLSHIPSIKIQAFAGVSLLVAGDHHTCFRDTQGDVYCWGLGASGQLGVDPALLDSCDVPSALAGVGVVPNSPTAPCAGEPRKVVGVSGVTKLWARGAITCASDGTTVTCWGDGHTGVLGAAHLGFVEYNPVTVPVGPTDKFFLGPSSACLLTTSASLKCWGAHDRGQLGVGDTATETCNGLTCATTPKPISTFLGSTPIDVALGARHGCAVLQGGTVRCWGADDLAQLGDSAAPIGVCGAQNTPCATVPSTDVFFDSVVEAKRIFAGDHHTCVVTTGIPYCWGDNRLGQSMAGVHASVANPAAGVHGLF